MGATIPGISSTEDKLEFLYEACSASLKVSLSCLFPNLQQQTDSEKACQCGSVCFDSLVVTLHLLQDELNTAKVPVAIKAAGVDADGHWTRQNLAQVIWYSLLLVRICSFSFSCCPDGQNSAATGTLAVPAPCQWKGSSPSLSSVLPAAMLVNTMRIVLWLSGYLVRRSQARRLCSPSSRTWCKICRKQPW